MIWAQNTHSSIWSFPTRERGLKFRRPPECPISLAVVPHAGTWIEIPYSFKDSINFTGRSPRGNVD